MAEGNNNHIENYEGRKKVYERVQRMIEGARSTLSIMTTENGIVRMHKIRERTYREAIERGVNLRIALPINRENLYFVQEFVNMGAKIRHLPDAARNRFVNVDGRQVIAHLTSQDDRELEAENDYGMWTDIPEFVELTTKFFDNLWEKLTTYRERRIHLKFGIGGSILLVILYVVFIFAFVQWMLSKNMSEHLVAILCGIVSSGFWVLGHKLLKMFYRRAQK